MACTNCFSGCVETTSDKCIKYTGNAIEFLGISTGDSLELVEKSITDYLLTVLSGEGILPDIDPQYICEIVAQFLPGYVPMAPVAPNAGLTLIDVLTAIIRTLCLLETEIVATNVRIDTIEADYTIPQTNGVDCLVVNPNDGTHIILQSVITKLCIAVGDITQLYNLYNNCVKTSDIAGIIQTYLNGISPITKMYNKMVPYVAYPYYPINGDLTPFSLSGAGIVGGAWEKVYLCNGNNGTPDLRGRIIVGTSTMATITVDPKVAPGGGNPNYTFDMPFGDNTIILSDAQVPNHSHTMVAVIDHKHTVPSNTAKVNPLLSTSSGDTLYPGGSELSGDAGAHSHVINPTVGGGGSHSNIPPVRAMYYIMFIP